MAFNIPITSTYFLYLVALSAIMVIPCSIASKGCISVGLENYLCLLNWKGNIAVIHFQPPQLQWNNHLWYTEVGRYFLTLLIHCLHVINCSYSRFSNNPTSSVNTLLCYCFLELGLVFITLSIGTEEYAVFMLAVLYVTHVQVGIYTQGLANIICDVVRSPHLPNCVDCNHYL